VEGKSTFKEEFVTAGGVDLKEIQVATMESKLQEGLYFAGEVMDVDGITGGFNFQHAWTSGFVAASAIAKKLMN
jgi:predicted flavoprotein YhiN